MISYLPLNFNLTGCLDIVSLRRHQSSPVYLFSVVQVEDVNVKEKDYFYLNSSPLTLKKLFSTHPLRDKFANGELG